MYTRDLLRIRRSRHSQMVHHSTWLTDTVIDQCTVPLSTWVGNTWAGWANLRREKDYELLDGNVISAGSKHFRCQKSRSNGDQRNNMSL